jgi:hypothetical protein
VGLTSECSRISTSAEEISALELPTPRAVRKRDSGEKTMGVGLTSELLKDQ